MSSVELAIMIRRHVLNMVYRSNSSHIGSCLSIADILAVLYTEILTYKPDDPYWQERDRFILSKGHAAAALYATLAECGFFPLDWLESFNFAGARLSGHVTKQNIPGIEVSTGSLGHGLSIGLGIAKAAKLDNKNYKVYVLLGDGECDEGSIWEAALLAPQLCLDNICVIIDYNKIQSFGTVEEVIDLEPFAAKWNSFGWDVIEINGHDHNSINHHILNSHTTAAPSVIIAHTMKGKGVSFMENKLEWHYKSPNEVELTMALDELGNA